MKITIHRIVFLRFFFFFTCQLRLCTYSIFFFFFFYYTFLLVMLMQTICEYDIWPLQVHYLFLRRSKITIWRHRIHLVYAVHIFYKLLHVGWRRRHSTILLLSLCLFMWQCRIIFNNILYYIIMTVAYYLVSTEDTAVTIT